MCVHTYLLVYSHLHPDFFTFCLSFITLCRTHTNRIKHPINLYIVPFENGIWILRKGKLMFFVSWNGECPVPKDCWLLTDISAHQLVRPHRPLLNAGQPCNHGCSLDSLKRWRRHLWRPLCPATSTNCHSLNMSVTLLCQVHFNSALPSPSGAGQENSQWSGLWFPDINKYQFPLNLPAWVRCQ